MQDVAARALWLLAKDQRQCLSVQEGQLGCDAAALAGVLAQLIELADAEDVSGWVGRGSDWVVWL